MKSHPKSVRSHSISALLDRRPTELPSDETTQTRPSLWSSCSSTPPLPARPQEVK